MAEPRNYIRATTGGFNGTTADTATYTQLRTVWTTPTNTLVGVFSPEALGRTAGDPEAPSVPSYVRVMLSGVVAPGDQVRVLNSAGVARYSVDASVVGTDWLFLGPGDSIAIASPLATSAELLVLDVNAENLPTLILAEITQANGSSTSGGIAPQSSQNMAATGAIDAFNGDLVVFVSAAAPATLTLPALGTVALGSTVTGGRGVRPRRSGSVATSGRPVRRALPRPSPRARHRTVP